MKNHKNYDFIKKAHPLVEHVNDYFNIYIFLSLFALIGIINEAINMSNNLLLSNETIFQKAIIPYYYGAFFTSLIFFIIPIVIIMHIYKDDFYIQSLRFKIYSNTKSYIKIVALSFTIIFILVISRNIFPQFLSQVILNHLQLISAPFIMTLAIIAISKYLIFFLNINIVKYYKSDERLVILSHFQEYPKLTEGDSSFLLSESNDKLSNVLKLNLPNLDYCGLNDLFIDIQLVFKIGSTDEKKAVQKFLIKLAIMPTQLYEKKMPITDELIKEIDEIRQQLPRLELFREKNNIKGVWKSNYLEKIKPYESVILIFLTLVLIILTYFLIP